MPQAQGANALLGMQYEEVYGVNPGTPDLTKIYFSKSSLAANQPLNDSDILSGDRNPSEPLLGNIDVKGSTDTELQAYIGMLLFGATGSIETTMIGTGEALGAALTTPTAIIDPYNMLLTVNCTAHGLIVGKVIQVAGITAPIALNDTYLRVMKVPTANQFVCRIPRGVTGAFTLGAGTLKAVTTAATAYQHKFKSGGMLPSFIAEIGFPDVPEFFLYNGVKVASMSVTMKPDGFQSISFNLTGSNETSSATSFDSTAIDLGKQSFSGAQMGSIIEDVGGANTTLGTVSGVDLSLENNLDDAAGYVCGSGGKRASLPARKLKLSGNLTVQFDSMTLYNKAVAGTKTALKIPFAIGTGLGLAGNESLEILFCELKFGRNTPAVDGDGGVMVKLPITGFYANNANGAALMLTLKNTQPAP